MRSVGSILLCVVLACTGCSNSDNQADRSAVAEDQAAIGAAAAATAASEAAAATTSEGVDSPALVFADVSGEVQPGPNLADTTAIVVATWCPYSRKYIEVVRDLSSMGLMDANQIVFIFADEREHIAKAAKEELESGNIDQERYEQIVDTYDLNSKLFTPMFYDSELLDDLPATGLVTTFPKGKGGISVPRRLSSLMGSTDDSLIDATQKRTFLTRQQFLRVLKSAGLLEDSK